MRTLTCDECGETRGRHLWTDWREVTVFGPPRRPDAPEEPQPTVAARLAFCSLICEETWCGRERERVGDEAAPASERYPIVPLPSDATADDVEEAKAEVRRQRLAGYRDAVSAPPEGYCPEMFGVYRCQQNAGHEGLHGPWHVATVEKGEPTHDTDSVAARPTVDEWMGQQAERYARQEAEALERSERITARVDRVLAAVRKLEEPAGPETCDVCGREVTWRQFSPVGQYVVQALKGRTAWWRDHDDSLPNAQWYCPTSPDGTHVVSAVRPCPS